MTDQKLKTELKPCWKCGANVELKAEKCPECESLNPAFSQSEMFGGTLVLLFFAAIAIFLFTKCTGSAKPDFTEEDRRKGYHCLRAWDGSHDAFKRDVKSQMRDPKSFEHIETKISLRKNGQHYIFMDYRAKNGFGGMTVGKAKGTVDSETCRHEVLIIK